MEPSETAWIRRALAGDAAAFACLYDLHVGRVRAYLRRCGFADADVDDLAQDVFVRAWRSLRTFDLSRPTAGPWLGAIARNVARRAWGRRARVVDFDPDLAEVVLAAADADPRPRVESRESDAALGDCVDRLPPDLARLVRLRYVDGLTTRALAAAVDMAEATVRLRLDEAKRLLEKCLESKGMA